MDTCRRKGYKHSFQLNLAVLCVKVGPNFKNLMREGVKVPNYLINTTFNIARPPPQVDVQNVHESVMSVKSLLSVEK